MFRLDVNPEPWAIGPVGYARRAGKMSAYVGRNAQLDAYKQAIKESIEPLLVGKSILLPPYRLDFWFWRNHAEYLTPQARTHRKHQADGTNMMKATEDALQGVLIGNDRDVKCGFWNIVEQGPNVEGAVIIRAIGQYNMEDLVDRQVMELYLSGKTGIKSSPTSEEANVWPPRS